METNNSSETKQIIDLASQIKPIEISSEKHIKRVALPPGWNLNQSDDEHLLPVPARKKGNIQMDDVDSFIKYITRHKIVGITTVYCMADYARGSVSFRAVINDHDGAEDGQQWRDFVASYTPKPSVEWIRWLTANKQPLSQSEFAMFIEDNLADIAAVDSMPTGQQLLEMALSFQANQEMKYKSSIRLQNGGVNMSFVQDDDNQTLVNMQMFEKIAIGIPAFWNGDAYQINARLRYRVKEGSLKFWYELIREDRVLQDATENLIEKIKTETGVDLYFGKP